MLWDVPYRGNDAEGAVVADCRPGYFEPWIDADIPATLEEWWEVRDLLQFP